MGYRTATLPVILALLWLPSPPPLGGADEEPGESVTPSELVSDLRSDGVSHNALTAHAEILRILRASRQELVEGLVAGLVRALRGDDLQQRQMAASLLVAHYQRAGIADAAWPAALIDVLVEGLRDDGIRGGRQVANGRAALRTLFGVRDQRPVGALESLLAGEDPQARWGAAVILAEYHAGSVRPAVSDELLVHLASDRVMLNEAAAFRSLRRLGEANTRALLARIDEDDVALDAQQAAKLLCLGAWFGIPWEPPAEAPEQWLRQAREGRARIATTALFVYPRRDAVLEGERAPSLLERMIRLGPSGRGLVAESHWAADWVWWLRTDDASMGLPGIALYGL